MGKEDGRRGEDAEDADGLAWWLLMAGIPGLMA